MRNKKCKLCKTDKFKIYPNNLCQKCLSLNFEGVLRKKGKEILIDSESLINDYLVHLKSQNQIAKENKIKPFKVRKLLNDYSIPIRNQSHASTKYVNKDIFKVLNVESAFLLGYIFTDGDLLLNLKTEKYFLRIYSKYRYKIENVKSILSAEAKIQHRGKQKHKNINQSEMFFIHIGNQNIIDDLLEYGLVLKKNKEVRFPKIPKKLIPHFIRGIWSGSGCVSLYKNTIMSSLNIGSLKFITEIEKHLNLVGLKRRNIYTLNHSMTSSYLIKYATKDSNELYKYIYKGATDLTICRHQEKLYKEFFVNNLKW